MKQALYKIWDWYETPYKVLIAAPWEKGTWVVRVDKEEDFPFHELDFRNHKDWDVEEKIIEGTKYFFIKNPGYMPWPEWHPAEMF